MRKSCVVILAVLSILVAASGAYASEIKRGTFSIEITDNEIISILEGDRQLAEITKIGLEDFDPKVNMQFGFFDFDKKNSVKKTVAFSKSGEEVLLETSDGAKGKMLFENAPDGALRVKMTFDDTGKEGGMLLIFSAADSDRFWGFGEQYSYMDFRGVDVPIWVQEQGVGREEKPRAPYMGKLTNSYFPMPYFMDPEKGMGFLLENSEYSRFNICPGGKPFWMMEVWDNRETSFLIFPGPTAKDVVRQLTAVVGRPQKVPPDWTMNGVWLAGQGGTEVVKARLDKALAADIPVTAVWSQDWLGARHFGSGNFGVKYKWSHDDEWYPGLEKFIKEYSEKGVRFLGYFNPFIVPDYEHYDEMAKKGLLIKDKNGDPYLFQIITFKGSLVDVTNPEAVEYFKDYARKATAMGQKGWMADFGEWLPFDSIIAEGDAREFHNKYATEWHRINREVLDEAYPDGDYAMITRSGFTGEQGVVHILWAGDQESDFDPNDGMPTVVTAGLTAGLSGLPYFTHDLAGFSGGPTTKEVFLRWTELAAFTPFMRTHDGLQKFKNHRFDSDEDTLAFFRKFAKIHTALFPYFKMLAEESAASGAPIIRHTAMVDPGWEKSYEAHKQWMLGDDLLFVPVTEEGRTEVQVYFPEGDWENLFDGEVQDGRTEATVKAEIGAPAVFVRKGSMDDVVSAIRNIYSGN